MNDALRGPEIIYQLNLLIDRVDVNGSGLPIARLLSEARDKAQLIVNEMDLKK